MTKDAFDAASDSAPQSLQATSANNLRSIRKILGYTLKQVADALETTPQTIQRLETDNMTLSMEWVEKLSEFFKVPANIIVSMPGESDDRLAVQTYDEWVLLQAFRNAPEDVKQGLALILNAIPLNEPEEKLQPAASAPAPRR